MKLKHKFAAYLWEEMIRFLLIMIRENQINIIFLYLVVLAGVFACVFEKENLLLYDVIQHS